ncbi:ABC transporter ATP-binding protein [Brachybacterium sp. GU-2]|nr:MULTISPECIES: ABC transporter ATP-binding protein [Brachybacterium]WME23576.1 ABC transporter ATP-binding protein [Brachybacterium sp. GU-2]
MPVPPSTTPPPSTSPEVVAFEGIGVLREESVLLLEASGRVDAGEVLAVTGPNGSGKTTLLRVIAGLLAPTAGRVRVAGRRPDDRDRVFREALSALIGPAQTARDLTVLEHLQFVGATWGSDASAARARGRELLEELRILPLADRFPHELSSGQSQLVSLALALARPSAVLVLDEPEQRLDPDRLDLVIDALRGRARAGTAIVLASHSPRLVDQLADGRLALEEPW